MEVQQFFEGIESHDAAHSRYRTLALTWHPDRCRDRNAADVMMLVNTQYKECLARLNAVPQAEESVTADDDPGSEDAVAERPAKPEQRSPTKPKRTRPRQKTPSRHTSARQKKDVGQANTDLDRILNRSADLLHDALGVALKASVRRLRDWLGE